CADVHLSACELHRLDGTAVYLRPVRTGIDGILDQEIEFSIAGAGPHSAVAIQFNGGDPTANRMFREIDDLLYLIPDANDRIAARCPEVCAIHEHVIEDIRMKTRSVRLVDHFELCAIEAK